jgi:hypothetical protein
MRHVTGIPANSKEPPVSGDVRRRTSSASPCKVDIFVVRSERSYACVWNETIIDASHIDAPR